MRRIFLVLLLLLWCKEAGAFGFEAHVIASRVAWSRMNAETRAEVERLLALKKELINSEFDSARNNRRMPYMKALPDDLSLFEKASLTADLIRSDQRRTSTFHYINVPIDTENPKFAELDKKKVHVISKVEEFTSILRDIDRSDEERADALLFLIHLVEDLHQPLHVGSNSDLGGNRAQVRFEVGTREFGTNLHAVWDYALLEATPGGFKAHFEEVAAHNTPAKYEQWAKGEVTDWALESFKLAQGAYLNPLSDPPRRIENGDTLGERYRNKSTPVLQEQICKAGHRLAYLLNETWKAKK